MATLKEQREAAAARKAAASASLTDADRAEIEERDALASEIAAAEEEERKARKLSLDRREDAARAKLGPKVIVRALDLEATIPRAGTFILRTPPGAAWDTFRKSIGDQNGDHGLAYRAFAGACVEDWNGQTDITSNNSAAGSALAQLFRELPALPMTIANVGGELAGLAETKKKSGG